MDDRRPSIGILALQAGIISQKQLMECLEVQRSEGTDRDIQEILVEKGYLKAEHINSLLKSFRDKPKTEPPPPGKSKGGTRVTQKQTEKSTKPPTGQIPAPKRERTTKVAPKPEPTPPSRKKPILLAVLLAAIPLVALGSFLVFGGKKTKPKPSPDPAPHREPVVDSKPKPDPDIKKPPVEVTVDFPILRDTSDLAKRWNQLAEALSKTNSVEMYARSLKEIQILVAQAKGTPHQATLEKVHDRVLQAIDARATILFEFIAAESQRLSGAGKYGDAVAAWEWFPLVLDPLGRYEARIKDAREETRSAGLKYYEKIKTEVAGLVAEKKFEEATLRMLRALESGLKEITEDAFKRLTELTDAKDAAARKAEQESLAEFERQIKAQKETGAIVDVLRTQFWDLILKRRLETAGTLLATKKKDASQPDVQKAIVIFEAILGNVRRLFSSVETWLKARRGGTVTLAFDDEGKRVVRVLKIKDVSGDKLVVLVEGKELTESVLRLHSDELIRIADSEADSARRSTILATAYLMAGEMDKACSVPSSDFTTIRFVEGSSAYLAKNSDEIRRQAQAAVEAKEYEKAIGLYTKLVTVPSLKKEMLRERAKAYYLAENFVGAVYDVDELFQLGVVDKEAIGILNQSYERSALIQKAIDIYEGASRKMPEDATVLANLISLYMKTHDYEKAQECLGRAKKLRNWDDNLAPAIHLLNIEKQGAFPGKTYRARFERYDVITDVSQEFANEMAQFMHKVYQDYVKIFPYKKNESLRFHLKLFATEGGFDGYYKRVTGSSIFQGTGKVGAYYMPITKELVGWKAPDLRNTLQHEGLHQYIDYFVDNCPMWFNEGYASYFEKSTADRAIFNEQRHKEAQYGMVRKKLPRLRDLLLMSREKWKLEPDEWMYYGQSWSFIYFLIKQGRKDVLDKYFDELMKGRTQRQAYDAVFGPGKVNIDELEAKWRLALFNDKYD